MHKATSLALAAAFGVALSLGVADAQEKAKAPAKAAAASCIRKTGEGTNTTADGAKFQAYEAILQATDWGMWSQWMASSQKIGQAPGYKVTIVKSGCKPGGWGQVCFITATLCK
jgi:hypothetical protein